MTALVTGNNDGDLRLNDWFCGAGGATQGAAVVPGVRPVLAANHDEISITSHASNFPDVDHFQGDIKDVDVARHPYAELFWSSPECTFWSQARGKHADYADHPDLFDTGGPADDAVRSRALMHDVVRYLRGMVLRQQPVLAGVVENVVDIRKWIHYDRWLSEIQALGYRTRTIALNSMHAQPRRTPFAPQSRDRFYLAYWHISLGRDPDWDKWLRPRCWCTVCEEIVDGIQTWKRSGQDMGRYGAQYFYRCPKMACRGAKVEPFYRPAHEVIDWTLPGQRIGDRARPLSPKTMARIEAALEKWGPAVLEAAGNTFERRPGVRSWPITDPLRTLHTTASKAVVTPPFILDRRGEYRVRDVNAPLSTITANDTSKALFVPVEGRDGKAAKQTTDPLRTQTARNDLGLLVMLRGQNASKDSSEPLDTVAASGNHHGLLLTNNWSNAARSTNATMPTLTTATTQGLLVPAGGTWHETAHPVEDPMRAITTREGHGLLVPYYSNSKTGRSTDEPMPTIATRDHFALIMRNNTGGSEMSTPTSEHLRTITTAGHQSLLQPAVLDPMDCLFRMLEPHEIGAGMAFGEDYIVLGNKRQRVKQYGNAVTPPVAEVLVSALVECIQGHDIDWSTAA